MSNINQNNQEIRFKKRITSIVRCAAEVEPFAHGCYEAGSAIVMEVGGWSDRRPFFDGFCTNSYVRTGGTKVFELLPCGTKFFKAFKSIEDRIQGTKSRLKVLATSSTFKRPFKSIVKTKYKIQI